MRKRGGNSFFPYTLFNTSYIEMHFDRSIVTQQFSNLINHISDLEEKCEKNEIEIILPIHEYMNVVSNLIQIHEINGGTGWSDQDKINAMNKSFGKIGLCKGVRIGWNGDWVDESIRKGIRLEMERLVGHLIAFEEVFFICLNEYHEMKLRENINIEMLKKSYETSKCIELFETSAFYDRLKDKNEMEDFYFQLAQVDLKPYTTNKTNTDIIRKFGILFDAFHLPQYFPYSLSNKYKKIFGKINASKYARIRRMLRLRQQINLLKEKDEKIDLESKSKIFDTFYPVFGERPIEMLEDLRKRGVENADDYQFRPPTSRCGSKVCNDELSNIGFRIRDFRKMRLGAKKDSNVENNIHNTSFKNDEVIKNPFDDVCVVVAKVYEVIKKKV